MPSRKERVAKRRQRQKNNTILFISGALLLMIVVVLLLLPGNSPADSQASGPAQIGKTLEDFSLKDVNGKTVSLSDYGGKSVLINTWATWCPPCKAEMPDLQAYYQAHRTEDFVILAINAGESASQAAAFADQTGLSFPVLLDPEVNFINSLGIRSFPTSILVGPDGVVKTIHVGMFTPQALEAEITPYLSK